MMSLSVRPQRRLLSARVSRSQSFAGVLGSQERGPRSFPAFSPPGPPRKPPALSRVSKMFSVAHPAPKVPQPERLDLVYTALKRGLTAYLEVHQQEQEKLQGQIRESKRNSRLGFLYDLDKQVKSIERFLRRLEFHASKIDELYEAYCVQRRLRDGAYNMVRAYSTGSPGSREARDSLAEATRGHREYTESMCLLESELEAQLGEFHLRMKGLAGFARLCVGDQYEIYMKYGRQRWKLRGRIESSGKQVWDSEETVFLPLLAEFLSIKVTELKGLANHVVVGSVSCETKDLFAALPQVVAVDINDLGTIKLSLEVTWSPFDKDDQPSAASTVNKASTVTKRFSTYSQSPPDTPSLREQAFYNMLRRQEELENGTAWSLSSESSDDSSSPQLSGTARHSSAPRPLVQQPEPLPIQVAFRRAETSTSGPVDEEGAMAPALANGHAPYSRTLSHISEASVDAALAEASVEAAGLESLVRGPSPPAHPDPTHGEHPSPVSPALDSGHSTASPTLSTTDPAPSAHLDSVNKTINSSSSELPDPTHTTASSTSGAIRPTHSTPSPTHTTTGSAHKTAVSTLTPTGPTPSTTGPVQTTTSPTHKPMLSTLTPAAPTPTTTDPVQTTTSLSHTVTNLVHTVISPTNNPMVSTLTTAGPTASATGPAQTTTSPTHTTASPTHTTVSPTHTATSPTHTTVSPTHTATSPTHTTISPTHNTASPTHTTISPTHNTASPTHTTTSPTYTTATPTHKARISTHSTILDAKDPVQTTGSPTHSVTSFTLITVSPSTFLDLATLSSPSANTDPPLPGVDPLSCSYPASTPCTQADPITPSTSHPTPTCSSWEPLTSPSPNPPEANHQSPSLPPSPLAPVPQHSDPRVARASQAPVPGAAGGAGDRRLEEALGALMAALDDYRGQFPELQGLEQEVTRLESLLMQRQGLTRSRTSSLSITVEHALESFSFLNEDEDEDNDGPGDRPPNSPEPGAEDSLDSPSARPLSTECPALDAALVQHLYHCSHLLLKLGTFGPLRCQEAWALERLLREARVLEAVCELSRRWEIPATSAQEVVQFSASRPGFLTFWDQCTEGLSPFICPVEQVLLTFCNQYSARLSVRQPGLAEAVCVKFLEDALGQKLPRRPQSGPGEQLTIFQFWSYVEALDSSSMEAFVTETAEEVLLVRNLNSDDQAVVLKALRLAPEGRLRRDGLRALSSLLVHGNNKVMAAVSTQLRSLSLGPAFRERALLCFLDQLEDEDVQTRVAGCLALGCIKASEGIEPLVYLCQTDTEAVREAARQSLQQCGEEGQSAHRRLEESLDALPRIFGPGSMASTAF
ncbi:rho family-interacting cell polarization regulator 1 isoform X3 [Hippopotamus amphibius kiboko]|nr:rho family-interacting cell polarization regulator 1 isoform X3 [Hippopotamus amphibius kiboko]XP_057566580.1 rho family-interacting cell polarization regulator 1 isoform X3 [Hippopotamus amphibius kiboko]XP_057566581.1 rho family-interacting cell polarization regulator 1 isoform X3 [Hippopotamus amphibius kiboko]XP_057566582.1 rho family-interacting cell polarization regulator 1 isoform X3 [Hippopotamus amphibius kiboko]XP_057566583.1 rho family-interacting cell polarization regulator 1 iso